ncbi:MAG: hypothetical protein N2234_01580 [Planctomycetota bacterium]|nr:hypothetical protein [Planctomycetota bacterium]
MAKKGKIPWALEKRTLLYDRSDTEHQYWGDLLFDEGRYVDALEFYLMGSVVSGIEKIKRLAIEEGDYYLLAKIAEKFPDKVEIEDWRATAYAAMRKGKFANAVWAYGRCGEKSLKRMAAEKAGIEIEEEETEEEKKEV